MSGADAIAEIGSTFPARGIVVTSDGLGHGINLNGLWPETNCAWCGERFVYDRAMHKYKRHRGGKLYMFCRYSCLVNFDKSRPDLRKKRVDDCRKRLEYLESLRYVPRDQWSDTRIRDNGIPLSSMISNAESRLNTAYEKFLRYEEA